MSQVTVSEMTRLEISGVYYRCRSWVVPAGRSDIHPCNHLQNPHHKIRNIQYRHHGIDPLWIIQIDSVCHNRPFHCSENILDNVLLFVMPEHGSVIHIRLGMVVCQESECLFLIPEPFHPFLVHTDLLHQDMVDRPLFKRFRLLSPSAPVAIVVLVRIQSRSPVGQAVSGTVRSSSSIALSASGSQANGFLNFLSLISVSQ